MTLCGNPLSRSLLGVKRTWVVAAHMSAFDPKRTADITRPSTTFANPSPPSMVPEKTSFSCYLEETRDDGISC
jgi:hypothetical protein